MADVIAAETFYGANVVLLPYLRNHLNQNVSVAGLDVEQSAAVVAAQSPTLRFDTGFGFWAAAVAPQRLRPHDLELAIPGAWAPAELSVSADAPAPITVTVEE